MSDFDYFFLLFVNIPISSSEHHRFHRHQIKFDSPCSLRNSPSPSKTGRPDHQGRSRGTVRNALISPRGRINWSWCEDHGVRVEGRDSEGERQGQRRKAIASVVAIVLRPRRGTCLASLPSVHNLRHGRVLVNALHDDRRDATVVAFTVYTY